MIHHLIFLFVRFLEYTHSVIEDGLFNRLDLRLVVVGMETIAERKLEDSSVAF